MAYIAIANADDERGVSHNDGGYFAYISVTDENILPTENANPARTLRMRYDAWVDEGMPRRPPPPSLWRPPIAPRGDGADTLAQGLRSR